jgi:hypothetical protein
MGKKTVYDVGASWGHLKVVFSGRAERYVPGPGGGEMSNDEFIQVECDCEGKMKGPGTMKIWLDDFPGKKKVLDCGCGISNMDGATILISATVPTETRVALKEYSRKEGISFSRAIVELVRLALKGDRASDSNKTKSNRR